MTELSMGQKANVKRLLSCIKPVQKVIDRREAKMAKAMIEHRAYVEEREQEISGYKRMIAEIIGTDYSEENVSIALGLITERTIANSFKGEEPTDYPNSMHSLKSFPEPSDSPGPIPVIGASSTSEDHTSVFDLDDEGEEDPFA